MTANSPTPVEVHESEPAAATGGDSASPAMALRGLWQRYRDNAETHTENALVEQYLPLVKTIVGRLAMTLPSHLDIAELQSAGVVGLLHAIRNFDPENRASFETYARFRIRGAVIDELRRLDWASRTIREKTRRIQTAIMEIEQRQSTPATEKQIAAELKISTEEYQQWLEEVRPATFVCLDSVSSQDQETDGRALSEMLSDPAQESPLDVAARREIAGLIAERIKALPEMQRKVLSLYYFEDLRLAEIAEAFGVTESRICQIHAQAILSIRSFVEKAERGSEAMRLFRK